MKTLLVSAVAAFALCFFALPGSATLVTAPSAPVTLGDGCDGCKGKDKGKEKEESASVITLCDSCGCKDKKKTDDKKDGDKKKDGDGGAATQESDKKDSNAVTTFGEGCDSGCKGKDKDKDKGADKETASVVALGDCGGCKGDKGKDKEAGKETASVIAFGEGCEGGCKGKDKDKGADKETASVVALGDCGGCKGDKGKGKDKGDDTPAA